MVLERVANRLSPLSVPVLVFGLLATVLLVVPPLVAGPMTPGRAYLIAGALLILAVGHAVPYAAAVAVVTLPVLWAGSPGYASPESVTAADGPTTVQAVQHVVVGGGYALASAGLGGVLVGAEVAGLPLPSGVVVPAGAIAGGLLTGGTFVAIQLWRYRTLDVPLDPRTTLVTVGLGGLLAPSPAVAYWLFGGRIGGL
jgi:hypothetical protein